MNKYEYSIIVVAALVVTVPPALTRQLLHVTETAAAWAAMDRGDYEEAIRHADRCIEEFHGTATKLQLRLVSKRVEVPKGQVSLQQKEAIHQFAPLNDVATSYFVKGLALQRLGRHEEAIKAFDATQKLSEGRCWNPGGWFWSPAESALLERDNPVALD